MALNKDQRDALGDDDFAVPSKRLLPLVDKPLVLMAAKNLDSVKGLTDDEREQARIKIHNRGIELGVVSNALRHCHFTIEGMALDVPDVKDHPNRHPFSGIMTRLNIASDFPVGGTTKKKVVIPGEVGEKAVPSLLGMAIDYKPNFDGHDRRSKIGIITEAFVGEEDLEQGTPLHIAGFFYAADFPDEVASIQSLTAQLGFSYEAEAYVQDLDSDPWVCTSCEFTGAAVLLKNKAAFTRTSIAASKSQGETSMTPEEIAKLQADLADANKKVTELEAAAAAKTSQTAASLQALVKPHADSLRQCASAMLAAGIGADNSNGHAHHLNKMADTMEAEAVLGRVPCTYSSYMFGSQQAASTDLQAQIAAGIEAATKPLKDEIASLTTKASDAETKVKELSASAALAASGGNKGEKQEFEGGRKSMHPASLQLLKRIGLDASAPTITVAVLDAACSKAALTATDSLALKLNLKAAGLLAA